MRSHRRLCTTTLLSFAIACSGGCMSKSQREWRRESFKPADVFDGTRFTYNGVSNGVPVSYSLHINKKGQIDTTDTGFDALCALARTDANARNFLITSIMTCSDNLVEGHLAGLMANQAFSNLGLSAATTTTSALASVLTPTSAKTALSAAATAFNGIRSSVNEHVYQNQVGATIVRAVRKSRSDKRIAIREGMLLPVRANPSDLALLAAIEQASNARAIAATEILVKETAEANIKALQLKDSLTQSVKTMATASETGDQVLKALKEDLSVKTKVIDQLKQQKAAQAAATSPDQAAVKSLEKIIETNEAELVALQAKLTEETRKQEERATKLATERQSLAKASEDAKAKADKAQESSNTLATLNAKTANPRNCYTIDEALVDLLEYHQAGSLMSGLAYLNESIEMRMDDKAEIERKITSLRDQLEKTSTSDTAAREQIQALINRKVLELGSTK